MEGSERKDQREERGGEGSPEEIITTHINADFDALASMIAARKLYPKAALVFPGSQERSLRDFFLHSTSYLFNFAKMKQIDFRAVKRLILVDTRQKSRIGKFAELAERQDVEIHIYDHHADSDEDIHGSLEVIQKVGSTTALMARLMESRGMSVTPDEATIMTLGIHEDTGSFTFSSTTAEDYRAAAWLCERGADHNIVADMITRELSAEQIWLLNDITQAATTQVINGVEIVITKVSREEYIGDFAVLVHKFMEMENLDVVFALAQMEERIHLVARSRLDGVNVAEIAVILGGGGHPHAASATLKNKTLIQVERSLLALLKSRILPTKTARDMMSSPVIHISPEETVKTAAHLMTRYNINVLLVMQEDGKLRGYVTRQVVEKAVFLGLEDIRVEEYMNIEYSSVGPDVHLKEVQELIIRKKLRILPVMEGDTVLGVITRTDLLTILLGEPVVPEFYYDSKNARHLMRKKNMAAMLKERHSKRLIAVFKDLGHVADLLGYNAYLVGGLVRDVFLKRDNSDVDVVIEGDGIRFAHEFAQHFDVRVRSHKKFATAVLIFPDGFKVDVATARMEYYEAPGAPPIVERSSLKLDLYRRDFTINTLAIKLNIRHYGTLIDYFGAQDDIKDKVLRVLHNLSFVEDPTRILRVIRFEQRFSFKIGKLTLALLKSAIKMNNLKDLTGRRLFLELRLILEEQDPIKAIERMDDLDVLSSISQDIQLTQSLRGILEEVRRVIGWYNLLYLGEPFEPWKVYWHGLTSSLDGKALGSLAERLGMSDAREQRMIGQREEGSRLPEVLYRFDGTPYELYTMLLPYDTETLLYVMGKSGTEKAKRLISIYFSRLKNTRVEIRGKDLLSMGYSQGPLFREIFEGLLEARLNDVVKTREDEIEFIRERWPSGNQAQTYPSRRGKAKVSTLAS